jgi:hypothetical protein
MVEQVPGVSHGNILLLWYIYDNYCCYLIGYFILISLKLVYQDTNAVKIHALFSSWLPPLLFSPQTAGTAKLLTPFLDLKEQFCLKFYTQIYDGSEATMKISALTRARTQRGGEYTLGLGSVVNWKGWLQAELGFPAAYQGEFRVSNRYCLSLQNEPGTQLVRHVTNLTPQATSLCIPSRLCTRFQ